jgi:putative drug exporter of the RND superfamily
MVLVPATMSLLGHLNWWLPAWLDRLLPEVSVEGPSPVAVTSTEQDDEPPSEASEDDEHTLVGV